MEPQFNIYVQYNTVVFVLTLEKRPVSTGMVILNTLINFKVFRRFRGQGYAAMMMRHIMDSPYPPRRLIAKPFDDGPLSTEQLISFYQKFGFLVINDKSLLGVVMKKPKHKD